MNLGLCCINTVLQQQNPPIFNSRTCQLKNYTVEVAKEKALKNIRDLILMIEYNHLHGIKCFRLSSDIFPRFVDAKTTEKYTIDFAHEGLKKAGDLAKKYGMRILMHPGQYNQIASPDEDVFSRTVQDLEHHADILDVMGIDDNGILIIHGGGRYNDKEATTIRWIDRYHTLPKKIRRRLALENCERGYSIDDVVEISQIIEFSSGNKLPVIFDSHHYECWNKIYPDDQQTPLDEILPEVLKTWGDRRPLMHVSNQGSGRIGHHSDFIQQLPQCFIDLYDKGLEFDLEVEAKAKQAAIYDLRRRYSFIDKDAARGTIPKYLDFLNFLKFIKSRQSYKPYYDDIKFLCYSQYDEFCTDEPTDYSKEDNKIKYARYKVVADKYIEFVKK